MRIGPKLHTWLKDALVWCHLARFAALLFAVEALVEGGVLTLAGLGRARGARAIPIRYRIKCIDRLLGNRTLHLEVDSFSRLLAGKLIGRAKQPVLLVDWTPLWGPFHALTASVPYDGRALLLYWEVHREKVLGNARVHGRFLTKLAQVVPAGCKPIVVTDAGFHSPWFKSVRQLGWDYVGRVRAQVQCMQSGGSWVEVRSFHDGAQTSPRDLGIFTVSKSNPIEHRLILVRKRRKPGPKKRVIKRNQKPGPKKKGDKATGQSLTAQANKHRVAAKEPWVLATSLRYRQPHVIVHVYKRRMQTEETYRQVKSTHFGWELKHGRSKDANRLRVLLLISAVAAAFLMAVGMAAEATDLHLRYQANTVKKRRVLSLISLAQLVLREGDPNLSIPLVTAALDLMACATIGTQ